MNVFYNILCDVISGCVENNWAALCSRRYEEDYERLQAMNELLESEEAPLPQAALQQWLQKLDVGWNKLLEMWESRREVLVQAHIFHLFLRDVKQAESFLNNQVCVAASLHLSGVQNEILVGLA